MKLSSTTLMYARDISFKESVSILSKAGFDAFDVSLVKMGNEQYGLGDSQFRETAAEIKKHADSLGITCNQAHAPYPSSVGDAVRDAEIFKNIVNAMEAAAYIGAKIIVVHPQLHLDYPEHPHELFEINVKFYKSLIPYAEKFGIKVAAENIYMRTTASKLPCDTLCSRAWEFKEMLDAIGSDMVVGCMDVGHAALMGADLHDFVCTLGKKYLKALHIHDVDENNDIHTMPYLAETDYTGLIAGLAEIGYDGDFTFESVVYFKKFPKELLVSAARLLHDVGRYFISEIEK